MSEQSCDPVSLLVTKKLFFGEIQCLLFVIHALRRNRFIGGDLHRLPVESRQDFIPVFLHLEKRQRRTQFIEAALAEKFTPNGFQPFHLAQVGIMFVLLRIEKIITRSLSVKPMSEPTGDHPMPITELSMKNCSFSIRAWKPQIVFWEFIDFGAYHTCRMTKSLYEMLFCLAEAASILPSNVCPHEKQHSPYLLNSSNMASALDVFGRFQDQAIDFSRRNRLLRYPKTAHSIQFDGDSMNFRKKYMETGIEDLSVDFFHKDILRIEELEEIKQNGDGGSKRKKTADESEQKSMNPEEFTEEMERELETLLQKVPECSPRGEKLIRALERFRLENKRKLEEHGLHTLFLAIGRVRWKQPMAGKRSSQNAT